MQHTKEDALRHLPELDRLFAQLLGTCSHWTETTCTRPYTWEMSRCALGSFGGLCTTHIGPHMCSSLPVSGQNAGLEVLVVDTVKSSGCQQNNKLQEHPGLIGYSSRIMSMLWEILHHFTKYPIGRHNRRSLNRIFFPSQIKHISIIFFNHLINHQCLCWLGQSDWAVAAGAVMLCSWLTTCIRTFSSWSIRFIIFGGMRDSVMDTWSHGSSSISRSIGSPVEEAPWALPPAFGWGFTGSWAPVFDPSIPFSNSLRSVHLLRKNRNSWCSLFSLAPHWRRNHWQYFGSVSTTSLNVSPAFAVPNLMVNFWSSSMLKAISVCSLFVLFWISWMAAKRSARLVEDMANRTRHWLRSLDGLIAGLIPENFGNCFTWSADPIWRNMTWRVGFFRFVYIRLDTHFPIYLKIFSVDLQCILVRHSGWKLGLFWLTWADILGFQHWCFVGLSRSGRSQRY